MIYLLDANVLIDANRDYYPIKRIPEFWDWLVFMGMQGSVKIPFEIYEEVKEGNDDDILSIWAKKKEIESVLLLDEEIDSNLMIQIVNNGYANNLSDDEFEMLGNDPFLIAYAFKDKNNRCIVTTEVSKPKRQRANRHIPDVCNSFNIPWCNTFKFIQDLNFSTHWKTE